MAPVKIVVWDNIGNTLLGVRPWASWVGPTRDALLAADPAGALHAPSFDEMFSGHDVDITWFVAERDTLNYFGGLQNDFPEAIQELTSMDLLDTAIEEADYVVIHKERLPAETLHRAKRLQLIQHLGLDHRGVPVAVAREMGIAVAATPLVNYLAVAEHVWALILSHLKRLPALRLDMQERTYLEHWGLFPGIALAQDCTLGLLGLGEIARPIARVARAFDMPVIYWDIERFPELEARHGVRYVAWDDLFQQSDIVSVQLALNEQTEGIIGAREVGLMKPGALFVNTARGKLVDQPALVAALARGHLGGVALDVFAEEPLPTDDPLHTWHERREGNVALTPHVAWQNPWTWVRDSRELWDNVLRSLRGEPIKHLV